MNAIRLFNLQFSLPGALLYLLLLSLLCSLGFWQLRRADEKRDYLEQQQQKAQLPLVDWQTLMQQGLDAANYRRVQVTGQYDTRHQLLLDNQILDGKPGYFVLTPLLMDNGKTAVLVNRGWVALGQDRKQLPDVRIAQINVQITGRMSDFPGIGIKLEGGQMPTDSEVSVVQWLDHGVLSAKWGYAVLPKLIELDPQQPDGYRREWQNRLKVATPPEKHIAYAMQWFALALTLTVLFIWISRK